ncbi:MAG: lactate utilization protein [Bacteroidales bacterium]|nr:lactate utilization protein [Bacteroidales bacterium]
MKETTTKEKILKGVRDALLNKTENPFQDVNFSQQVYQSLKDEKEVEFARKLIEMGGAFVYCANEQELIENLNKLTNEKNWPSYYVVDDHLKALLQSGGIEYDDREDHFSEMQVGVTRCDFLIARFGSVMVSSGLGSGRRMFVFPEVHVVVAYASQVVKELKEALNGMRKKYSEGLPSQMTVITGPSRTADIEKTLVMGAHGPRELYVFYVDDQD